MIYKVLFAAVCVWIFVYTVSYAVWGMKNKTKLGAVCVFALSAVELALSVYTAVIY